MTTFFRLDLRRRRSRPALITGPVIADELRSRFMSNTYIVVTREGDEVEVVADEIDFNAEAREELTVRRGGRTVGMFRDWSYFGLKAAS